MTVSLADQRACAKREVAMRERVYARRVAAGSMTQTLADRELAAMRAIVETLEKLAEADRLI